MANAPQTRLRLPTAHGRLWEQIPDAQRAVIVNELKELLGAVVASGEREGRGNDR